MQVDILPNPLKIIISIRYALYFFVIFCTLLFVIPQKGLSQDNVSESDTTNKVVRIVRFVDNDHVNDNTLETLIRTHTNREFLGISRFTPWYYIWRITKSFGEPPALLNKETVANDMERIRQYYRSIGFLEAHVDTNIVEFKTNRIEVSFLIDEGKPSLVETLSYSGMPQFQDSTIITDFYEDSPITGDRINDSTYIVENRYSENAFSLERNRIINFLKNNGYASIQRDSVIVLIKKNEENPHNLDAMFSINSGRKYTFGDVYISLASPDDSLNYQQKDTVSKEPLVEEDNVMFLQKDKSAQTKFSLLTDQILFKPGATFDNSLYLRSVNEFQNLGMLSVRQSGLSTDGSQPDYSKEQIPVMFSLQTLPKHSANFNIFGMRRYGFGSGAGVTYTNNNLFGKAENLQINLNGSFEYVSSDKVREIAPDSSSQTFESRIFQSFESRLDYTLPRLIFPFVALDDNIFFSNARTRYVLSFSRSNQLLFDINSDIRFNLRYEVQHNQQFSSFLDLIELDLLDTDPSPQFRRSLEEEFGENSFQYERILEDFRPQVSSILRYTFRSQRTDLIKRNYGYFSEYAIAVGGNVPYIADRYLVTPDTLEGNLPPLFISNSQNSLAYSRFVKGTADYRRYIPISDHGVFGYRGYAGLAFPYANSNSIPINQRFFAGGTNDIRGWGLYSLGPGGIPLDDVTINGGEIKLLLQTEARQRIIKSLFSANWIAAWFTDAGNVWYGPRTEFPGSSDNNQVSPSEREEALKLGKFQFDEFYRQIGVGSGAGIRLDWEYVIVRFDFAFRIHDLQEGWFNNKKLYFSFGIGHSF